MLLFMRNCLVLALIAGLLYGISNGFVSVMNGALLQINTPNEKMARVFSAFRCVSYAAGPLGILTSGILGEYVPLNYLFGSLGIMLLMTGLIAYRQTGQNVIKTSDCIINEET